MYTEVLFYKEGNRWYADVPGHSQEENEMVAGADTFLEILRQGANVKLAISQDAEKDHDITLFMIDHDEFGATYITHCNRHHLDKKILWICNVTHDVIGEHPEYMFIDLL